jgi:hypothetical protein
MALVQFFKSRKETPVMLDFVEETLHQMSLFVPMLVIFTLLFAVFSGRDHRLCFLLSDLLQKGIRVIGTVGNRTLELIACNQIFSLRDIMPLPSSQKKAQWIAQSIYNGMDFGAEPASASTKGLRLLAPVFFKAPAAQGCARTTVLSSKIFSISGSPAKC